MVFDSMVFWWIWGPFQEDRDRRDSGTPLKSHEHIAGEPPEETAVGTCSTRVRPAPESPIHSMLYNIYYTIIQYTIFIYFLYINHIIGVRRGHSLGLGNRNMMKKMRHMPYESFSRAILDGPEA